MTGRSGGLLSVLGATLRDECFLAKNSKLDTLNQLEHPERSWWNADVPNCDGLDADRFGIVK